MLRHTIQPLTLSILALGLAAPAWADTAPEPGTITVQVTNLQNSKGQIGCSLWTKDDGFPSDQDKAKAGMFVKPNGSKATCVFKGVQPGTYAVSVMHDENKDGELETSLVGRPQEWWGVSNDVPAERFGPPKFEKTTFRFTGEPKTITIKLQL